MTRPKFLQARKAFLYSPISSSETGTIVLSQLVDCYGNQIQTTDFATTLRLTINPGASDEEIISCTGFTINSDGTVTLNAGITRGLAATYPYTSGGTASSHSAGTPVIILPDNPQLFEDILAYIDGLVLAAAVQATVTANGYVKLTKNNTSSRIQPALVSQQASPNMTVLVTAFEMTTFDQVVSYAGGNSGTMTAPVSNPRIDLIVYDTVNTVIAVRTGTEAGSPSAPTPTSGDITLAQVYHRVGATSIKEQDDSTNSYIKNWYRASLYKTGVITSSSYPIVSEVDQSQTTSNSTVTMGEANATTKHSLLAQSFVPTVASIRGVKFWKIADTGSFTGTVKVSLQASTSGSPSGTDLASYTITNANWLKITAAAETAIQFGTQYEALTVGATYWIVFTMSTGDNSNHPNVGANSAGGYASGALKFNNSTDGWTTIATSELYFKTLMGSLSKVPKTDSTQGLIPTMMRPYSFVYLNTTPANSSGTTEVTVSSKLLEGGFFGPTTGIRVRVAYNIRPVNGGSNLVFNVKLNGTTVATITNLTTNSTSTTTGYGVAEAIILNTSLTAQAWASQNMSSSLAAASAASLMLTSNAEVGTAAVDTSGPVLWELTMQEASTSNTSWAHLWSTLEKIG